MGSSGSKPKPPKKAIEPDELIRLMDDNPDVVIRYYNTNRPFIEKYIVDHFWEEDVERWLDGIRKRSPAESLQVRMLDFLKIKNERNHQTSRYDTKSLVLRRAGQFDIDVHFGNRGFDQKRDDLLLNFSVGSKPTDAAGTKIICPARAQEGKKLSWNCHIAATEGKKVMLRVNIPADAVIGRYAVSLSVVSGTSDGRNKAEFTHDDNSIVVLFNPFSAEDTVYMEDEASRNEYVFNDTGFIAQGSYQSISEKAWDFAQFDYGVLDNVLKMIRNDSRAISQPVKSWKKCNDPVYVSRVLSAMVNCDDDTGVLYGRWDGEYKDGKSPGQWSSSGVILKQWADNNMEPVKYGQCWVFSGVLTTALRAIGIPARSITNFESAHDRNANVTIDFYYDADSGEKLDDTSDSLWNYHVWNEGWFKRPDLPEEYGGWQVLDATPQELSAVVDAPSRRRHELFQCGPCPVKAIKEGRINLGFDGNFIFGEVNATIVKWIVKDGKVTQAVEILTRDVGKNITTKAVGSWTAEDVTYQYKYAEGTEEEQIAFNAAYGRGTGDHSTWRIKNAELLIAPKFEVKITQSEENVKVGAKVSTTVKVKNISDGKVSANIKISANSKRHIGSVQALLKKLRKSVELVADQEIDVNFGVEGTEYVRNLVDGNVVNIRVVVTDPSDGNTQVEDMDVQLDVPECISTTAPASIPRDRETKFKIVFENKMPITLTKGVFEVFFRGNKLYDDKKFTVEQPIVPGQKDIVMDVQISPEDEHRWVYCIVNFDSAELNGLQHSFKIEIHPSSISSF